MEEIKKNKGIEGVTFLGVIFSSFFFLNGLFNEYLALLGGIVLAIFLLLNLRKKETVCFKINLTSLSVIGISLSYFLTVFWAVDRGAAFIGAGKFLALFLFAVILMQNRGHKNILNLLPACAVIMTVISAVLMQFKALERYFSVAGRLAGFFQYSNTFALFLLVALIVLVTQKSIKVYEYVYLPVLIFGIIYSGSRTVFVLLAVTVFAIVLFLKNKKMKWLVFCATAVLIFAAVVIAVVTRNVDNIGRFLTISLKQSTFVGRLLYFRDALPLILKNPFGTGYLGYYYLQSGVQTGLYSVRFIHNDFLQLLLDIGWIPTSLFVFALVKSFFKKGNSLRNRLIIFVICAHSLFDFNLQFTAVFMLLIAVMDWESEKEYNFNYKKSILPVIIAVMVILVYLFCALLPIAFKNYKTACRIYPFNTEAQIVLLTKETDVEKLEQRADNIIEQNRYISVAYSAKARCSFSKGEISDMMDYKRLAIKNAPFSKDEYEDYIYMLTVGVNLYMRAGNFDGAEICQKEILRVYDEFKQMPKRQSKLGRMIKDQPEFSFSKDVLDLVKNATGINLENR